MKVHDDIFQTLQLRLQVFKLLLSFNFLLIRKTSFVESACGAEMVFFS